MLLFFTSDLQCSRWGNHMCDDEACLRHVFLTGIKMTGQILPVNTVT